jgi:glycosyltransferase involved in cell wall biosynthesis
MRLLCITSHGDTLNSVRPEAELFIGLQKAGVAMTVMTQGDSVYAGAMREAGIEVVDFVPRRKFSPEAIRRIRRELRQRRIDVVYAFNNKAIANANFAALGLPVKVVTYRGQTGNIHRWDPSAYLTHLSPRVDLVLCVADAVRDSLRAQHRRPGRVRTVYKGHSLEWYREPPADLGEFAIPSGAFTVICVANNRPRKGVGVLVEATYRLPREADIHLLLAGGGLEEPELAKLIGASPMRERIHVAGFRRDATALVAACSASVLPSLKREGLPKTVIESMAFGVPPIVTDTGGSAELVLDGQSGLVVPPGDAGAIADAIRFLYENPTERALMGRRARERLDRHFNVADTVSRTKQLLEELLEASPERQA